MPRSDESSRRFSRQNRLRKRPEYTACYAQGQRFFSKRFIVFVRPRPADGRGVRLGTAVSRKIGKAVQRNRVKRLLRELFRLHRHELNGDVDMVIVPKRGIDVRALNYRNLEPELWPVLRKGVRQCSETGKESGS